MGNFDWKWIEWDRGREGIQIQRWRRATDSVATTVAKSAGGRECLARKVVTVASSPEGKLSVARILV